MKLIHRHGEVRPYRLVVRVFKYRRAFRWIITDSRGLDAVLAYGEGANYRAARARAQKEMATL